MSDEKKQNQNENFEEKDEISYEINSELQVVLASHEEYEYIGISGSDKKM